MERVILGNTGIKIAPVIFGSSAMGNLYRELDIKEKRELAAAWFREVQAPIAVDSAGKYGAGLALETLGSLFSELGVPSSSVILSNKLGWKRVPLVGKEPSFEPEIWKGLKNDAVQQISYRGILECWEQGCELLGPKYLPALVSVHDPDEYLAETSKESDRRRKIDDLLEAYRALSELKSVGAVRAVGIGAKNWKVVREITSMIELDWVMLACSLTIYKHPPDLLAYLDELRGRGTAIINSAVFHAGFLTGGEYFDYRKPDPQKDGDLFSWRERFRTLCKKHSVAPEAACVEFGLSHPAVAAVAVNTTKPERVAENVALVSARAPRNFWMDMKENGLIEGEYPYLPKPEVKK